jgi:hypothetical protein
MISKYFKVFNLRANSASFAERPRVNDTNVALVTDLSDDSLPYIKNIYIDDLGYQDDRFELFVEGALIGDFGGGGDTEGRDWDIKYSDNKRGYLMRFRNAETALWYYASKTNPTEKKRTLYLYTNGENDLKFKSTTTITVSVGGSSEFSVTINPVLNGLYVDGVLTAINTSINYGPKYLTFDVDVPLWGTQVEIAQRMIKFTDKASTEADWS